MRRGRGGLKFSHRTCGKKCGKAWGFHHKSASRGVHGGLAQIVGSLIIPIIFKKLIVSYPRCGGFGMSRGLSREAMHHLGEIVNVVTRYESLQREAEQPSEMVKGSGSDWTDGLPLGGANMLLWRHQPHQANKVSPGGKRQDLIPLRTIWQQHPASPGKPKKTCPWERGAKWPRRGQVASEQLGPPPVYGRPASAPLNPTL